MHSRACDLVDADQHRLAGLPARCAMLHEVRGDLVQSVVRRDHFVVLTQQTFEVCLLVGVERRAGDGVCNAIVEIEPGDSELLTTVFVNQLDGRTIFFRPLEVVP